MLEREIGYADTGQETLMHPLSIGLMLILAVLILVLPRRYAMFPILVVACFFPITQRVVIFGLNFYFIRLIILAGWIRLLLRGEFTSLRLNTIDKGLIAWVVASGICHTLLWMNSSAIENRLGFAYNILGTYFLFRCFILKKEDIPKLISGLALICIPVALMMVIESASGRNYFSVFGGVPEFTVIRDGRLRCQGSFSHPILAGLFGATLLPLFLGRIWVGKGKAIAGLGSLAAVLIVLTSASSGPILAAVAGVGAFFFWPLRKQMRMIRWSIFSGLLFLHMVMEAPVWALIWRLNIVSGSTGYHRYKLINGAIDHFGEWWLLGTRTTRHWGYYTFDLTNHYIFEAVNGGLLALIFFVAIIAFCFRAVGICVRKLENPIEQKWTWALGAALFSHAVAFIGVAYFGQSFAFYTLLLAAISSLIGAVESATESESKAATSSRHGYDFDLPPEIWSPSR